MKKMYDRNGYQKGYKNKKHSQPKKFDRLARHKKLSTKEKMVCEDKSEGRSKFTLSFSPSPSKMSFVSTVLFAYVLLNFIGSQQVFALNVRDGICDDDRAACRNLLRGLRGDIRRGMQERDEDIPRRSAETQKSFDAAVKRVEATMQKGKQDHERIMQEHKKVMDKRKKT